MSLNRRIPAISLGLQGGLVIAAGLYGLARPVEFISQGLGVSRTALGDVAIQQLAHSSGLELITMGTYFCLAARYPPLHRLSSTINVGLRLLAAYCFWQDGPQARSVAMWELLWAGVNGVVAYVAEEK